MTHVFLRDPVLVQRLENQATEEGRKKIAVVIRALERYFAALDAEKEKSAA